MDTICNTLQIPTTFNKAAAPTPTNTSVNRSKNWAQLTYPPPTIMTQTTDIPPINNQNICLPLKYQPQFYYYTDGSFIPPREITRGHWRREKTWYGIYNSFKNLNIVERLPRLQNILQAELMAIHHTLRLLTTTYINKPTHIFTDCLNVLYLLNTQIKHPTMHNNHPDKNRKLSSMSVEWRAESKNWRVEFFLLCWVILGQGVPIFMEFMDSVRAICWKGTPFPWRL